MLGVKPETTAVPHKGTEKVVFTNIEPVECKFLLHAKNCQVVILSSADFSIIISNMSCTYLILG